MNFNEKNLENSREKSVSLWCGVVPVELVKKALLHLDDQASCSLVNIS